MHLTPRGFKLLEILVQNRPHPVPKSELNRQLWPDTYVSEGNLTNLVFEIRRALHDDQNGSELVRTVHGFGYAFIGEAQGSEAARPSKLAMFRLLVDGHEVGLPEGETWIGRSPSCRIQISCPAASRRHARIVIAGDKATIEDGQSTHGTIVNSQRISGPTPLHNSDVIRIGSVHSAFIVVRPDAPTDRTPPP